MLMMNDKEEGERRIKLTEKRNLTLVEDEKEE